MKWMIWLAVGGAIGAALGYFGQCTTGTCPLTANWKRGAMVGAVIGLVMFLSSGADSGATKSVTESSSNVRKITEAEFDSEVLKATVPVVVDFYAPWCGPCRKLSPMLDRVAGAYTGKVKVVKVNVDDAPNLAREYNISGIPALKFFRDGQAVGGMVGLSSEQELDAQLRALSTLGPTAGSTAGNEPSDTGA